MDPTDLRELKALFKRRVRHWAKKLDVEWHSLAVRPMRQKWASCSTNGNLNFNRDLLALDRAVWDYVIVHELLHFFVPNHGKLWKMLMRAHLGDYEAVEETLREVGRKGGFQAGGPGDVVKSPGRSARVS